MNQAAGPLRILFVEDDLSSRLTSGALLADEGFDVETAASLGEARRLLLSGRSYALVLLDLNLGDGMGVELLPIVRTRLPSSKVVLLSGDFATAYVPGVDGAFEKGGDFALLLELIHTLLS